MRLKNRYYTHIKKKNLWDSLLAEVEERKILKKEEAELNDTLRK